MIGLIQRVSEASVSVDGETIGRIGGGLLVLACVQRHDTDKTVDRLADRILGYRVFPDETGRMNRSLKDTGGGLLLVPQFTLAANTKKGMRASFAGAADPEIGERFFERLLARTRELHETVESGRFGADMQVALVNDGPVTFWIES